MTNEMNTSPRLIEFERERVELRLKGQIDILHTIINSLELKLENNQTLFMSDGLHATGTNIDVYLSQLVAYDMAIEIFKKQQNQNK